MTLTAGMPYRKQGKPAAPGLVPTEAEPEPEPEEEPEAIVIDTAEYQALLDAFTDKNGKARTGWVAASIVGLPR